MKSKFLPIPTIYSNFAVANTEINRQNQLQQRYEENNTAIDPCYHLVATVANNGNGIQLQG